MRSLLDVNVLIALLDADHSLHTRATGWFAANAKNGWSSCPITQNGCVRIMSHPGYPNTVPVSAVMQRLGEATASSLHAFWPDDISLLDKNVVNASRVHGPRQLTDTYLLALAVRRSGRFVTFDAAVSLETVRGAAKTNLVML